MKKTIIMVIAFVFAAQAGALFAGEKACGDDGQCRMEQHQGMRQEKRLEQMTKELSLTPEQKEKVSGILKESAEKTRTEMQKAREAAAAARIETDKQIAAVLTPEQAQKYEKLQAERNENMHRKHHRAGDGE